MANESSVTVTFQAVSDDGTVMVVVPDDEMNQGKTCFLYGEKFYFKIYLSPENMILDFVLSDGVLQAEGEGVDTIPRTGIAGIDDEPPENVQFMNTNLSSTDKPIKQLLTSQNKWLGNNLGSVVALGGQQLKSAKIGVGVYRANYTSYYKRFSITLDQREEDEYLVICFITGTVE